MHTPPSDTAAQPHSLKALTLRHVMAKVGRSKSAIYSDIQRGLFPAPIRAGGRSLWIESELDSYLAALVAERDRAKVPA